MGIETDLLQMLEPAVRPAGLPAATRSAPKAPIEAESFESLLDRAHALNASEATRGVEAAAGDLKLDGKSADGGESDAGRHLGAPGRIDNSSLQVLLAGNGPTIATA